MGITWHVSTPKTRQLRVARHRKLFMEPLEERRVLSGLWLELDHLTASDGMVDDELGYDVAISGDTMVVGAPFHNDSAGAAYVFAWDGTAWTEQAKLTAVGASPGDGLGLDVDIDGDTIIAGVTIFKVRVETKEAT